MTKKFKKQAEGEIKALSELLKYISGIPNINPLTKALLSKDIMGFQETLWEFWDVEIKGINFFNITDAELFTYSIQMQSANGGWMGVGYNGFEKLPANAIIRLMKDDQFFEANGQTEFILSASPIFMENKGEHDRWSINYQV